MIVKLNTKQFEFLETSLAKERADLFKYLSNGNGVALELDDQIAVLIRDWVGEKLQEVGFDENYELNDDGKILEQLEDILFN